MKKPTSKKNTRRAQPKKPAWLARLIPSRTVRTLIAALLTAVVGYVCNAINTPAQNPTLEQGKFACFVSCLVLSESGQWSYYAKHFAVTAKTGKAAEAQAKVILQDEASKAGLVMPSTISVRVVAS